jgi:hypothetical protein
MSVELLRDRIEWCEREARACEWIGATRLARWWYEQALRLTDRLFEVSA